MWICVLICPVPHFLHPSIYFLPFLTLSPFITQLSVYFSPLFPSSSLLHASSDTLTCQNDHLSGMSPCVCVCIFGSVQGKISVWPTVIGKDCLYYRLLLRDSKMTNRKSACVCVSRLFHVCVLARLLVREPRRAYLIFFSLPLCLSMRPICCLRATTAVKRSR